MARPTIQNRAEVKDRLKRLRAMTGCSQAQVAERIGVKLRRFQGWENVERIADLECYDRLARFYSEELGRDITVAHILYSREEREERLRSSIAAAAEGMVRKVEGDLLADIGLDVGTGERAAR